MTPLLSAPLLRTQSDRRLVALAGAGHDRAFEAIVERYRRPLARYLRRLLSEPLAEDVLQATFVRAWQALRDGSEVHDLRPWLYRIAHNQAVNALKAAGAALPGGPEPLPAVSAHIEAERRDDLRRALLGIGALPDRQRAALLAVAVDDRPHADVAAELGLSDGALRQLLLRARTTLRAAATAITPSPLVTWLIAGQDATAGRVAEVAAGAGGVGVAFKAGAAVVAASAVVAGATALRDEGATTRAPARPHRSVASPGGSPAATAAAAVRVAERPTTTVARVVRGRPASRGAAHRHAHRSRGLHAGREGERFRSRRSRSEDSGPRGSHESASDETTAGGDERRAHGGRLMPRPFDGTRSDDGGAAPAAQVESQHGGGDRTRSGDGGSGDGGGSPSGDGGGSPSGSGDGGAAPGTGAPAVPPPGTGDGAGD